MYKNKKFGKEKSTAFTKNKRVLLKIPVDVFEKLKPLKKKYGIKSNQEIFDHLFVSGIIYFDRRLIEMVEKEIDFYKDRDVQSKLARLNKVDPPEYPEYKNGNYHLYPKDAKALNDFVIEKNWAKQWIAEILFSKFVEEDETVISLIERNKKLKVRSRKKQIARLAEDKWVKGLSLEDRKMILGQLTENYESRIFNSPIQHEVDRLITEKQEKIEEEDEIDKMLNDKIKSVKMSRAREIDFLSRHRPEDEALDNG